MRPYAVAQGTTSNLLGMAMMEDDARKGMYYICRTGLLCCTAEIGAPL